jgi:hypothetical protein
MRITRKACESSEQTANHQAGRLSFVQKQT